MPSPVELTATPDERLDHEGPLGAEFTDRQLRARETDVHDFRSAGPELLRTVAG